MKVKAKKKKKPVYCDPAFCDDCVDIGAGDFACMNKNMRDEIIAKHKELLRSSIPVRPATVTWTPETAHEGFEYLTVHDNETEVSPQKELKPCPFCGGEVSVNETEIDGRILYDIRCENYPCPAGPETAFYGDRNKVIELWNTRKG